MEIIPLSLLRRSSIFRRKRIKEPLPEVSRSTRMSGHSGAQLPLAHARRTTRSRPPVGRPYTRANKIVFINKIYVIVSAFRASIMPSSTRRETRASEICRSTGRRVRPTSVLALLKSRVTRRLCVGRTGGEVETALLSTTSRMA